jgi:hypothetical protein
MDWLGFSIKMLELICWIIAGLIIWEGAYIWGIKHFYALNAESWLGIKLLTGFFAVSFMATQGIIVFTSRDGPRLSHYDRLIWEVLIIGGVFIFFFLNKKLYDYITLKKSTAVGSLKGGKVKQ